MKTSFYTFKFWCLVILLSWISTNMMYAQVDEVKYFKYEFSTTDLDTTIKSGVIYNSPRKKDSDLS